jgi:uncharacterized protein (DUF58 family)
MIARIRSSLRWFYNYRSIRLTHDGTRFVLLTLAIGVAAINTGNNLLYLLLAMLLSLIVISGMLSEQCLKQLDIRRRMPEHIFANRPTTAAMMIANRKRRFPTFSLRVMDLFGTVPVDRGIHLLHLPPHASALQTYPLLMPRRGFYRLDGIKLLTPFPFGLFMKAASLPLPCELVVYPELKPLPDELVQELLMLGQERSVSQRGQGVGLYNLREYQAGDDSRDIHWKTSARQGRLTIKETEAEDLRRVTITLPTSAPKHLAEAADPTQWEGKFEEAVRLAASLITFFHERGYALRLIAGETEIPFAAGERQYYQLLRVLALCKPTTMPSTAPLPDSYRSLERPGGELSVLLMPWDDPRLAPLSRQVSRVIRL